MDMRPPEPRTIMFLDLETENHHYYGALASPRHPDNWVVMNGYAVESEPYKGEVIVDHYPTQASVPAQWLNIPDSVWLLVMHNAPFEMDWFGVQQKEQIRAFLKRGGRIFDTAYAEYLLTHQMVTYPSLDETAPKYGGTHKVDGIKVLWEQGVLTSQIDPALLREYLGGPEGDVVNTRLTFYGQYKALVEQGMWGMALERMEGLLFNVEAMLNGLYTDREQAFKQLAAQEQQLKELEAGFAQYRSHIPEYVNFNTGSDFHMSAWLFGGPIKYKGQVPWLNDDGTPKYEKADFVKDLLGNLYEVQEGTDLSVLDFDHGPLEKYKSGKNKGQFKVFREDTTTPKTKSADLQFLVGPLVDLSLMPKDIQKEFKKEFAGKRTLADDSPVYSTGKDALEMLSLRKEFSEPVRQVLRDLTLWFKIDKDVGTYYLREEKNDDGVVTKRSGALQYLTPQNIIFHVLNATATATTRLSANRPNMQNLPRGNTSDVKKMFVSRFGADGFIMEADYSALEVVTLAAFSKDKALTKALLDNIDMHCMRLSAQLKEPYEAVLAKAKDQAHPEFKRYDEMRTLIKPKAFSYQYGATAHGIAFSTGCTVEEAQEFIDNEKALFPGVESWFDTDVFPEVERTGVLHREMDENSGAWRMYKRGYWQAPAGTCYSFRQYPKTDWKDGQKIQGMQFKPTQMRNYPIQGESGFFVQGISGLLFRWLLANDFFPDENGNPRVYIINEVHDAFYFDLHKSVLDVLGAGVKAIMESLPQHFNNNFGYDLQVPFPAAVEFGRSMHEKIHWHDGVLAEPKIQEKLGWLHPIAA